MSSALSDIDISRIDPRTHLFFDDDQEYITDVRDAITSTGIPLEIIECPHGEVEIYDEKGDRIKAETPERYVEIKMHGFKGKIRDFLEKVHTESKIGNGIRIPMIRQIIEFESNPANLRERIYFFDFDRLLTRIHHGVTFAFGDRKIEGDISRLIPQYAKYLFSDHVGPEPANGRFMLLRSMFKIIGPERIYIITSNNLANDKIQNLKTGKLYPSPYKRYFIEIIRQLLPSFIESHLICTYPKNTPPDFNNKGNAIVHILTQRMHSVVARTSSKHSIKGRKKTSAKGGPANGMGGGGFKKRSYHKKRKTRKIKKTRKPLRRK
jgi:hypothetical protein